MSDKKIEDLINTLRKQGMPDTQIVNMLLDMVSKNKK